MLTDKVCIEFRGIAAKFIPLEHLDDLVQEVFLAILELPEEKLKQLIEDKKLKYYFIRLCKNNYYSKTSRYHYKYRKPNEHVYRSGLQPSRKQDVAELYFIEKDELVTEDADRINNILEELYWYERELFKLYVLGDNNGSRYTYSTLSKKTNISRMSIYTTIKGVKAYVAKRLEEQRSNDI